jgi:hypothetical protein
LGWGTHSFFWFGKWSTTNGWNGKIRTVPDLQKQPQNALILSITAWIIRPHNGGSSNEINKTYLKTLTCCLNQTFQLLEVKFRETVQWVEILFFCEKILKIKSSENGISCILGRCCYKWSYKLP